jgi:cupin fold WbuC family metalloprotein
VKTIALIDAALLEATSRLAAGSPRLRKNYNFHASDAETCNRLLNAIEPGSYVRPHCHDDADKDETLVVLRGSVGVLEFDRAGRVTGSTVLQPDGEAMGVNVPHGTFHSLVALAPGTVFFEAKAGPYSALLPSERPDWAPEEGSADAPRYLAWMRSHFE